MTLRRQYVKVCDIADFDDPEFLAMVQSILPERDPLAHVERKVWEFAMLALFMKDVGRLGQDTEALSVGAGDERIVFWLANRVGRVVASDIYGEGEFSGNEAQASMLEDPAAHSPFPYREDHLEVVWMDGRDLRFSDDSFDVVFTLSSIEHFGSGRDVARSAAEIGRVLKPGGYAVVVTECLVRFHPFDALTRGLRRVLRAPGGPLAELFAPRELVRQIVRPSGLTLLQPLELELSARAWERVTPADPRKWPGSETPYPMILMGAARSVFTSVCLVMQKPGA